MGSSCNIPARWYSHRKLLSEGRHTSKKFQVEWDTYGSEAFTFRLITAIDEEVAMRTLEGEFILHRKGEGTLLNTREGAYRNRAWHVRPGYVPVDDIASSIGNNISTVWRWLKREGISTVKFRGDKRAYITVAEADMFRSPRKPEPPPG